MQADTLERISGNQYGATIFACQCAYNTTRNEVSGIHLAQDPIN